MPDRVCFSFLTLSFYLYTYVLAAGRQDGVPRRATFWPA